MRLFCATLLFLSSNVLCADLFSVPIIMDDENESLLIWETNSKKVTPFVAPFLLSCDEKEVKKARTKYLGIVETQDTESVAQTTFYNWMFDNREKIENKDRKTIMCLCVWFQIFSEKGWNPPHSIRSRLTPAYFDSFASELQKMVNDKLVAEKK